MVVWHRRLEEEKELPFQRKRLSYYQDGCLAYCVSPQPTDHTLVFTLSCYPVNESLNVVIASRHRAKPRNILSVLLVQLDSAPNMTVPKLGCFSTSQ